ncbi:MAG: glycosyltransferase family 2 protein [Clostridium sp.]|nr:glycosyltransferase family 2 protein [Clostridium sp.]
MNKISIIIPVFNGISNTIRCLESLKKINNKNVEIIVVDDASTDNSASIIKREFTNVKVLKGNGDLWWSGGVNLGIKYSIVHKSNYIVLLNNDNIVKEDFLDKLLRCSKDNPNDIITSIVLDSKTDELIHAGGYVSNTGLRLYNKEFNRLNEKNISVEWCGGMGVLIPVDIFKDIGYFNEIEFPQYYGDADFMFRARKNNHKVLVCKESIVWNNTETTGLSARVDTFKNIKIVLSSIKSNYNFFINRKFYKRYFSKVKYFKIMIYRYGYLFGGFIKRYMLNKIDKEAKNE